MEALFAMAGPRGEFPFTLFRKLSGQSVAHALAGRLAHRVRQGDAVIDTVDDRYGVNRALAGGYEWLGAMDGPDMGFNRPLEHFIDSIRAGKESWSSGRDNLGTLKWRLVRKPLGNRGEPSSEYPEAAGGETRRRRGHYRRGRGQGHFCKIPARGGANLIFIYNSDRFRVQGLSSSVGT
jgi:hypothetical protein